MFLLVAVGIAGFLCWMVGAIVVYGYTPAEEKRCLWIDGVYSDWMNHITPEERRAINRAQADAKEDW